MISLFGVISLVVLITCVAGLGLHYYVMKRRTRLDMAIMALQEIEDIETEEIKINETETSEPETSDDITEKYNIALKEYEEAHKTYKACVSRFPGNIVAKVLNLP